jgi:hypothetical protein
MECMYVCMYVCVCVCIYVCMYVYVCVYVCIYASMYVCMYVCMHVYMYACMYVCMYVLRQCPVLHISTTYLCKNIILLSMHRMLIVRTLEVFQRKLCSVSYFPRRATWSTFYSFFLEAWKYDRTYSIVTGLLEKVIVFQFWTFSAYRGPLFHRTSPLNLIISHTNPLHTFPY